MMRALISLTLTGALAAPALAAEAKLKVEIPRLNVAEYHRPYVAIWIERPDQSVVGNIAVWYDLKLKDNEGTKWLKDMRQWWRRIGRDLTMPVDGISSATRAPGEHQVTLPMDAEPFAKLAAGEYQLVVEAAREVGGREILRLPFQWPLKGPQVLKVSGQHELDAISLDIKP
jgi:hypothetical protein